MLRLAPVMEAMSVGCTSREISRASGASIARVQSAKYDARNAGGADPIPSRRWPPILDAAASLEMTIAEVAKQQQVKRQTVAKACQRLGFPLRKRLKTSSVILPRIMP